MDIKKQLVKIHFFKVKPDFSNLKDNEKIALSHCINASNIMTDIYLDQVYAGNKKIYSELQKRNDSEGKDLLRYFLIHGSPWDGYNHNEPFIKGVGKKLKFGSFYPDNLTEKEWNKWLNMHPEDYEKFEDNFTVIKRNNDKLIAVPYSEEYKEGLEEAANQLQKAAFNLPNGKLKSFLELRANAFLTNDYFESDLAWIDTDGNPFEVTIGPYETYFDELLGLKASFESVIGLSDKDFTSAISRFTPYVPDFDTLLSQEFNFKPKGSAIPLEIITDVIRGGENGFGNMFTAYNLPNDRRVHELKGSKKVFSRTMMEAKFSIGKIIAERIFSANTLDKCIFDNRLLFILGHEIAHGLGPYKIKLENREISFEVALKELYSPIEEAKADMLGLRLLNYFRNCNIIDDKSLEGSLLTDIASYFSQWNKGFTEAHSKASLVEYNWLKEANALHYNNITKKYDINSERAIDAMSNLSTELLKIEMAGDYKHAKNFMKNWGFIAPELPQIIKSLDDIPLAVSPMWDLSELKK